MFLVESISNGAQTYYLCEDLALAIYGTDNAIQMKTAWFVGGDSVTLYYTDEPNNIPKLSNDDLVQILLSAEKKDTLRFNYYDH